MTSPNSVVQVTRIQAFAYRCPTPRIVETSFGVMKDRPAVFVRIEDSDGAYGWGEVFANWPAAGAEHRVNLLAADIAPLVLGQTYRQPDELFTQLSAQTRIRALQCGEPGPFQQVIAGLDIALWDLFAHRQGLPLRKLISSTAADSVPAYASGISIRQADDAIDTARRSGIHDFKVKVGFDATDAASVNALAQRLASNESLCADANQAWSPEQATLFLDDTRSAGLVWLEEPIAADADDESWLALAGTTPLAGGENISGNDAFEHAIQTGALTVFQPDVAKWGGITGCRQVARNAIAAGRRYCPHYLGGGIGLAASAELLAAVGGDGLLEVDANPNPLRSDFQPAAISDGRWHCPDKPGLAIDAVPETLKQYQTLAVDQTV